jgi:hypothetical protein
VKNVENIFYIDEEDEDFVEEGLQSVPQSGKNQMKGNDGKISAEKKNENKKTITRQ